MAEAVLNALEQPFHHIRLPTFKLKLPSLPRPSAMTVFSLVFASYFFVISGIIYDVIVEPPSIGSQRDEVTGALKPQVFLKYRVNGQFIIEGLSAGMLFGLGALGIIILDRSHQKGIPEKRRYIQIVLGIFFMGIAYSMSIVFLRMKIPGYGQM